LHASGQRLQRCLDLYLIALVSGKGHFGTVYHGEYLSASVSEVTGNNVHMKVAVKTLSRIEDLQAVEHFLREGEHFI